MRKTARKVERKAVQKHARKNVKKPGRNFKLKLPETPWPKDYL